MNGLNDSNTSVTQKHKQAQSGYHLSNGLMDGLNDCNIYVTQKHKRPTDCCRILDSSLQQIDDIWEAATPTFQITFNPKYIQLSNTRKMMPTQAWKDYQMTWNASEFGGVDSVVIHPKFLWVPDILLYNRWPFRGVFCVCYFLNSQLHLINLMIYYHISCDYCIADCP